jgi:two-component system cell cycle response regulator DivK
LPHERVLIVDDNPINLKLLRLALKGAGYEIRTAIDALDALEVLKSFRPSLVLMDLQMPGMDGLELTRRLKADPSTRDAIIVAVTAYAMKGDEQRAVDAGCNGYITKPIDPRTLATTVASYLKATP